MASPSTRDLRAICRLLFEDESDMDFNTSESESDAESSVNDSPTPPERRPALRWPPTTPPRSNQQPLDGRTLVDTPQYSPNNSPIHRAHNVPPPGYIPPTLPMALSLYAVRELVASLRADQALQQISCEYIEKTYFQVIQFALGGVPAPAFEGTISPRAMFRMWPQGSANEVKPWWTREDPAFTLRVVDRDFAIGRCVLLSTLQSNAAISRDLVLWARKFHPNPEELPAASVALRHQTTQEDYTCYDGEQY